MSVLICGHAERHEDEEGAEAERACFQGRRITGHDIEIRGRSLEAEVGVLRYHHAVCGCSGDRS